MTSRHQEVKETLSLIEGRELPYPSHQLLSSFITEAVDQVVAAQYVKDRLLACDDAAIVSDWSYIVECITEKGFPVLPLDPKTRQTIICRDGARCCVSGKAGTFLDPLLVVPVLPIPSNWNTDKPQIFDMLGAFFSPLYRDWWLSYVKNPECVSVYCSHWSIRRSAARKFAEGSVLLDRLQPSMIEYVLRQVPIGPEKPMEIAGLYPLLGDHSRSRIEKVDPRFVGSHARLCSSIRYLKISKRLVLKRLRQPKEPSLNFLAKGSVLIPNFSTAFQAASPFMTFIACTLLKAWIICPSKVRIAIYDFLRKLGQYFYGPPDHTATVQRLPFGLYLKYHGVADSFRNEFNALNMVRKYTTIPAPRPLDIVTMQEKESSIFFPDYKAYKLITKVPGAPLSRCQEVMSDDDFARIADQLEHYLAQIRNIPREVKSDMEVCNTLGKACRDPRIRLGDPIGPFADEVAFSQMLRFSEDPARQGHKILFTHADLNPRNILVDEILRSDGSTGWSVTGIVDWETAGYYPEYWEYSKAMFEHFRWPRRYNEWVKGLFSRLGDYSRELDVEIRSWEAGDACY